MSSQSSQTIKNLLKKFTSSNLLLLEEASEKLKVNRDYLMDLIKIGKVKAFKVDKDWFIEENWLNDFKKTIKKNLEKEIQDFNFSDNSKKFFKSISYKKTKKKIVNYFSLINNFFKFSIFSLSLSLFSIIFSLFLLFLIFVDGNKIIIANKTINKINNIYSTPINLMVELENFLLVNETKKINDENLTKSLDLSLKKIKNNLNKIGQVAGESEGFNE